MRENNIHIDLAYFRIDQATECLKNAEMNMDADLFKGAANRSYYCIFHSIRAVLALDRFDSAKHSGIMSAFRKNYIKTGIFPVKYSRVITNAFAIRSDSDYKDFYIVSKDMVSAQIENAREFLGAVKEYIMNRIKQEQKT